MTQLTKRKENSSGSTFPSLRNHFFPGNFFGNSLLNLNNDFWNSDINMPPANITETDKEFKLDLSVPGFEKEDFQVHMDHGVLCISSEKKEERSSDEKNYSRKEFSYSSFSRSFQLPENTNEDKISAKYENGVLQISIPKKEGETNQPKKQIKVA